MGPYSGGQAEYLRVPSRFNCLAPDDATEKEKDYVMLSDISHRWHSTRLAGIKPANPSSSTEPAP